MRAFSFRSTGSVSRAKWGPSVLAAFLLLLPTSAGAAPTAPFAGASSWTLLLLGILIGGATMGLIHWLRLRRHRTQSADRLDTLESEKQQAEDALSAATDRADKLREMSAAKSEFLEEVSHAFRRPLTLTLGPIDTLLEGRYGSLSEEVRTQLRLAQRNGTRLLWLVNQLLDLAELETGSMTPVPTEGNLPAFLTRSLRSFEDLAERRSLSLSFESSLEAPTVHFDEAKMETMLANLLSSAFRAAEEDGAVRVAVRPAEANDEVELLVEHTGSGPKGDLEQTPFDWARAEGTLHEPGCVSSSVGLHLADELADLHGGALEVETGEATRFVVRLPRRPDVPEVPAQAGPADACTGGDTIPRFLDDTEQRDILALSRRALADQSIAASDAEGPGPPMSLNAPGEAPLPGEDALPDVPSASDDGSGRDDSDSTEEDRTTVLVIDDNSVICTLVRAHLEPEYRVVEAHDGAEGYQLARSILPDLVISDVMMPEVDGFELCRKIKEDPDIDHVPVVFLTARADLEDKVEGFDTGADAYLTKPFEPEELIARTQSLIDTRQSLRESFRTENGDGSDMDPRGVQNAEEALPPTADTGSLKETIEEAIGDHLTDPEFGVSELAEATALSASQLRRRMKELYDRTPVQLIRRRRLEAGAQLLREREEATIGEVAYAVGFNSQSYFSRTFREEFGTSPSRYRKEGVAA